MVLVLMLVLSAPAAAAPVWLAPADVAPPDSGGGSTAIDADGTVLAVWSPSVPAGSVLRFAQRPPGGAWTAPVDLTPAITGRYVGVPKISIDDAGTATAAWEYYDQDGIGDDSTVVQSARRPRGGPWGTIETVSAPAVSPEEVTRTELAVAPGGAVSAVWQFYDGAGYRVVSARRPAGGAWEAPAELTTAPVAGGEPLPRIAVDDSGRATAVWTQSPTEAYAAGRDAGGAWDAPVTVSGTPGTVAYPTVAMDASGNATAIWRRLSGVQRIETATRAAGGSWGTPELLTTGTAVSSDFDLAVDPDGNALVAYGQTVGPDFLMRAKRRPAGGAWQATADDLSLAGANSSVPQALLDRAGNATVAWIRYGTPRVVQAAHASPSGAWSAPVDVATGGTDVFGTWLSANPNGDLALSWRRDFGLAAAVGVVPPTCTSTTAAAQAAAAVTIDLPCSGTVDTRAIGAAPALGALGPIDQALGRVTFTANPGPGGNDAFTFTGANAAGTSAPATVNLTITPQPPAAAGGPPPPAPPASLPPSAKPAAVRFNSLATLPSTRKCVSRRKLRIRLRVPKGVGVTSAEVRVNGRRVRTVKRSRFTAPVDLRNLPKGRVKVNIRVKLADGRTIAGTRTYRTCAAKKTKSQR